MKRMLRFMSENAIGIGNGVHIVNANVRAMVGARINMICDDEDGRIGSLINSFTPSATG